MAGVRGPERWVPVGAGLGLAAIACGVISWLSRDANQHDGQPVPGSGDTGPDSVDCMTALRGMPPDVQAAINPWDTFPGFETIGIDFANFGEVQGGQADLFNTEDGKFQLVLIQAEMRDWTSGEMQTSPVTFLGIREVDADGNCRPVDEIFLLAPGPQLQIPPEDGVGVITVVDQVDGIHINFDGGNNWQVDNERIPLLNLPRNDQGLPAAVLLIDENGGRHLVDTDGKDPDQFWLGVEEAVGKLLAIDANPVEAAPPDTLEPATSTPALSTPKPDADPQQELETELAGDRGATSELPTPTATPTEKPTVVAPPPENPVVVQPPPEPPTATATEAPARHPSWPEGWSPPPGWPEDTIYEDHVRIRLIRDIPLGSSENPMPGFETPSFTRIDNCRIDPGCPFVSGGTFEGNGLTVAESIALARQIAGDENARIRVFFWGNPNFDSSDENPFHVVGIIVRILK